ncbi:MAG: GAF domain-containing protein [Desulfuromonadaceae bacterium]|nr:GAF domain-containing protein [Desulfuromonadaceae bacterium]
MIQMSTHDQKLFRALLDVGKELAAITDRDRLLSRILEISREVFRFDNAIIRLITADGGSLETAASYGYSREAADKLILLGQGIMGKAARNGRPYLINNVRQAGDYIPGIEAANSELAVPLVARDRVIGVFNVESQQPDAFSAHDSDFLSILAGQAAIAIDNARLYADKRRLSRENDSLDQLNQQILHGINLGLYTVDCDMTITSWNAAMARMSHLAAENAVGRHLLELFPTLEQEGIAERLRRVVSTGQAEHLRLLHRGNAGENRLQKRRLTPLKDNGQTVGALVIVEDITEFEQLLAQMIQSEKLAEIGRMSAGVAHEINNPLAVISFASQMLLADGDQFNTDQLEMLQRIDSEVERLKGLTTELLSYSAGAAAQSRRPTDLNRTLDEVMMLMRYELEKKRIASDIVTEPLPLVSVSKNHFKQVFINLILNSVQAMGAGGMLRISTGVLDRQRLFIRFCDNGPGIADTMKERIFEPFFTSRKDGSGTGLGLYLCRKIVADYQGQLTVSDGDSGGCCFEINIPCDR